MNAEPTIIASPLTTFCKAEKPCPEIRPMSQEAPAKSSSPNKLLIRNIGLLLSGDLDDPILDADTVVAIDGIIRAVGKEKEIDASGATTTIDAKSTALAPGLIDSHVHPVCGDWTPRQNQLGWIESCLHGGVTTMVSAGEVHTPGRPKDIVGLKAMAIFAQRAFHAFRPGGVKVYAGAPVLEQGMVEDDFKELAAAGVKFSPRALEIVHNGNERAALLALRTAREVSHLDHVILGTDSPAGSGVQPLGILRMIAMLSSLGEIAAEVAICMATGNTAKMRSLNCGLIAPSREATFVFLDTAQQSAGKNLLDSIQKGDLPGVGMVITDGAVSIQRSRNTPPATRVPEILKS